MNYEPQIFELEKSSVWSFKERGDWATHDSKYRGNCSPYVFRNLIIILLILTFHLLKLLLVQNQVLLQVF